ncbi:antibiotic biosynthesis monooxygenase [Aliiroseovarius sp. S1339]|uniref:antibiotic biosynthesis monooxygenase family protein n=1 Tax=Aliiroseovarius sp. S1339 TaxID=2936990 RepID=UPI0020BFAA9D|nr:antibiotic biosynthesis monooxygenase [Aliiroseovarius sp. S1339]MCK8463556.1 antibiotic biosynthesis monooxygenase [Aliiroseovarius sp. S1339]
MTPERFAPLPTPPYYAVIFTNQLADPAPGYEAMADQIFERAQAQPGYLGAESTRDGAGLGITVSYWKDEASIRAWKAVSDHMVAQKHGIDRWYAHYTLRVAKVERAYEGPEGRHL